MEIFYNQYALVPISTWIEKTSNYYFSLDNKFNCKWCIASDQIYIPKG